MAQLPPIHSRLWSWEFQHNPEEIKPPAAPHPFYERGPELDTVFHLYFTFILYFSCLCLIFIWIVTLQQILISKPSLSWLKKPKDSEKEKSNGTCPIPKISLCKSKQLLQVLHHQNKRIKNFNFNFKPRFCSTQQLQESEVELRFWIWRCPEA